MESVKYVALSVLIGCCASLQCSATTESTPIQLASDDIRYALEIYSSQHNGQIPSSWANLDAFLIQRERAKNPGYQERSFMFNGIDKQLRASVEHSFVLVSNPLVEMARPGKNSVFDGGYIIAITAGPIKEDRKSELGRYVIWKEDKGSYKSSWLNETILKKQFNDAGSELPMKPIVDQPSTFDVMSQRTYEEYARAHFKNPQSPTPDELIQMKSYMAGKYGDKQQQQHRSASSNLNSLEDRPASMAKPLVPQNNIETFRESNWKQIVTSVVAVLVGISGIIWLIRKPSGA